MNRRIKTLFGALCILLSVAVFISSLALGVFENYYGKMNITSNVNSDDDDADMEFDENGVLNILLLGTDNRKDDNVTSARTDSMMIISLNKKTEQVTMTSILRDSYVTIPGHGSNRLNAAYSFGGPELLMDTLQANYGINVSKYAQVDFQAFKSVIKALGGVTVELTQAEITYLNQKKPNHDNSNLCVGECKLDATQALTHARNRHVGTDFERTRRQRDIISAILKEMKNASMGKLMSVANSVLPYITTNISKGEILATLRHAKKYMKYDISSYSLPQKGTYSDITVNGAMVLGVDFEANKKFFYDTVYGGQVQASTTSSSTEELTASDAINSLY